MTEPVASHPATPGACRLALALLAFAVASCGGKARDDRGGGGQGTEPEPHGEAPVWSHWLDDSFLLNMEAHPDGSAVLHGSFAGTALESLGFSGPEDAWTVVHLDAARGVTGAQQHLGFRLLSASPRGEAYGLFGEEPLVRLDSAGEIIWQYSPELGSAALGEFFFDGLVVSGDDTPYSQWDFYVTVDFGGGPVTPSGPVGGVAVVEHDPGTGEQVHTEAYSEGRAALLAVSRAGEQVWADSFPDVGAAVARFVDSDVTVASAGDFRNCNDIALDGGFRPIPDLPSDQYCYSFVLARFDPTGAVVWKEVVRGFGALELGGLSIDDEQNTIFCFQYGPSGGLPIPDDFGASTVWLGVEPLQTVGQASQEMGLNVLAKLDRNGKLLWAHWIGPSTAGVVSPDSPQYSIPAQCRGSGDGGIFVARNLDESGNGRVLLEEYDRLITAWNAD